MEGAFAVMLGDLFQRLDPQWDTCCAYWLQALILANQQGHICLPIPQPDIRQRLYRSPLVVAPGGYAPLILDPVIGLYFARHWFDEVRLAQALQSHANCLAPVNLALANDWLNRLFPSLSMELDRQKLAAALALRQQLLVISGGPGTGKTTTVIRLLALLAVLSERPLVMALAAPTGKAAARLSDAIQSAVDRLPVDAALKGDLPSEAQTLHRLLGLQPGKVQAYYHAGHTLPVDVLVVDEASMIDLDLMARTFDALPPHARVILLGDHDQLASVEAGAVLNELCKDIGYRRETLTWLAQLGMEAHSLPVARDEAAVLADSVVQLVHSHRFAAGSGIGLFSRCIHDDQPDEALSLLQTGMPDLRWDEDLDEEALFACRASYWQSLCVQAPLAQIARDFAAFMPLVVERRQVEVINRCVEQRLEMKGIKPPSQAWYPGRPVMITNNDYEVSLFNGDIGFAVQRPEGLRIAFPQAQGGWRDIAPARLPAHETVYAMTVHKSQGSEFDEVWLVLPEQESTLLDRALVYTAVTRARHTFQLVGSLKVLRAALGKRQARYSGLAHRMHFS